MTNAFWKDVASKHHLTIHEHTRLSGGDISQIYLLKTQNGFLVIKLNDASKLRMFQTEALGLETLAKHEIIDVPKVMATGKMHLFSYILLSYIASGKEVATTFREFGEKLAALHQISSENFGFEQDNFIGSLPQSNQKYTSWNEFYWYERIKPQIKLALRNKLLSENQIAKENVFLKVSSQIFKPHHPALLHGDLWNGNYMINANGNAVLIDPAVYYGHPMMDIGMSKLFGGFPQEFYDAYFQNSSISGNIAAQTELAQLYYLLVHLNLFGSSYYDSVSMIFRNYF